MTGPNGWREQTACRGMDVDLFFREDSPVPVEARRTCASCPVRSECLAFALSVPTTAGYWAGTTQRERNRMRRQRRDAA